ncbi:hypothetical protein NDR87_00075 [Nocardia sp. CDC159]|uniref:Low-density lipoprotein receptor class B n=1 Tax=Nocardia pulmonis TaxID=2951408 RepID=A0A9X2E2C0_9NOCA|nr:MULTISPECIES: hypothetical protein [Nocardia]MCM6772594.1 hypothetical protein [Nocardia pulmonis]MCM6784748.1 hypothetical protein [Nocardia sp. CDC159]
MKALVVLNIVKGWLQAVSLDGARVWTLVDTLDQSPDGVVVDQRRGHIYWTNMGAPDPGSDDDHTFYTRNGSIERVDLDGANRRTIVPAGAFTTGKQLTADFAAGKLYWCDREGMRVLRCDLDGSHLEEVVVAARGEDAARDPRNHCVGVALDPSRRMVYWSQKGAPKSGQGRIFRAPIDIPPGRDATSRDDVELLWDHLPEPIDLHFDPAGFLAWTDRGAEPDGNTLNRATVDPEPAAPQILSRGYAEAIGLAVDDGTYYVSDLGGAIRRVDPVAGTDTELVRLDPALTGLALAELPGKGH